MNDINTLPGKEFDETYKNAMDVIKEASKPVNGIVNLSTPEAIEAIQITKAGFGRYMARAQTRNRLHNGRRNELIYNLNNPREMSITKWNLLTREAANEIRRLEDIILNLTNNPEDVDTYSHPRP